MLYVYCWRSRQIHLQIHLQIYLQIHLQIHLLTYMLDSCSCGYVSPLFCAPDAAPERRRSEGSLCTFEQRRLCTSTAPSCSGNWCTCKSGWNKWREVKYGGKWNFLHLLFDVFASTEGIPSCVVRPIKGVPSRFSISGRLTGSDFVSHKFVLIKMGIKFSVWYKESKK